LGEEHETTLATMGNLCSVYVSLGMLDQAEALRLKDLTISERVLGPEHPDTLNSFSNLGALLRKRGRCDEAVVYLERATTGTRKVFPADYEGLGFTLGWYGSCLSKLGRHPEGEAALLEARTIIVKKMGEEHPIAAQMALDLFNLYTAWEKDDPGKGHAAKAEEWKPKAAAPKPDAE
jgi:tetratricopeptide (TPR) repeat protein